MPSTTEPGRRATVTATALDDPHCDLRRPLPVLCILLPLGLLAELYRFLGETQARLLAEEHWARLGGEIGVAPPLVPVLILLTGAMVVQLARRHPWRLPGPVDLLLILGWGCLWAAVRFALGFTVNEIGQLSGPDPSALAQMRAIAQVGLAFSAALQEELIFRAGVLGILILALRGLGLGRAWHFTVALPASALIFALAHTTVINHHPGALPLTGTLLAQFTIGGLVYGYVFLRQGLAVAVLAHALYNLSLWWS